VRLGEVRASPVRPRGARGEQDGRWYWRARRGTKGDEEYLGQGWFAPDEVPLWLAGLLTSAGPRRSRSTIIRTVEDLVDAYTWSRRQDVATGELSARTQVAYRVTAIRLVGDEAGPGRSPLADVRVDRLDRATVQAWQVWALGRYASSSVAKATKYLRLAWRWGRRLGHVPHIDLDTPVVRVTRQAPDLHPTRAQLDAVIGALAEPWKHDALELLWETGCRVGELAMLTAEDWDGEQLQLDGKTGARQVPVSPAAAAILDRLVDGRGPEDRIWEVKNLPVLLARSVRRAQEQLEQPRWLVHGLRKAWVDRFLGAGGNPSLLPWLLGHSPSIALEVYHTPRVAELEAAVASVAAQLGGTASEKRAKKRHIRAV
jgi:integrase